MEDQLQLSDRILFIHSDNDTEWQRFSNVLENNQKEVQKFSLSEISLIPKTPYDLIVVCLTSENENTQETLTELRKQFIAPSTPCVLITPNLEKNLPQGSPNPFPELRHVTLDEGTSKFLVTATLLLRLRKMRTDHVQAQVEVVSENATLRDLNNRFNKDIQEAREIHEGLLPDKLPSFETLNCASYYLPLELVGGDLFDMWKINDETIGVFLGDITGHGLPAAFIGAMTKMCMALTPNKSPANILSFINSNLSNYLPDGRFITAVCGFLDTNSNTLTYSSAGHPPPLHYNFKSNTVESLTERGLPINIDPDYEFKEFKIKVDSGDKIIFYSDGLYETVNMSNQMMGIDNLSEEFAKLAKSHSIAEILEKLSTFQEEFSSGRLFKDDVTILGVEIV